MNALNRLPCAEPLECRWLLSGAVRALELGAPADDKDIQIAVSALPAKVVAGLNAGFPRAEAVEASFSDDDGPEFGVTVKVGGLTVEVTLTPKGEIVGTEEAISSEALPRPVREWIHENYQGAQIDTATMANDSGIVSYDVIIVTRGGREIEATLSVKDEPANVSSAAAEKTAEGPDHLASKAADEVDGQPLLESEPGSCGSSDSAGQGGGADSAIEARESAPRMTASGDRRELNRPQWFNLAHSAEDQTAGILGSKAGALAALQAFAAGAAPSQWLPEVSGLLNDVLAMDVASIERGFGDVLDKVESLAEQIAGDAAASGLPARLAVAGVLMAGVLLLCDARKPRGGPVLVHRAANSSWSWVLGTSMPK